jgi:hypothetical protein
LDIGQAIRSPIVPTTGAVVATQAGWSRKSPVNQFISLKDGRRLFNLTTTLRLVRGLRTAQARKIADSEIELMFVRDDGAAGDVAGQIVRVLRERFRG